MGSLRNEAAVPYVAVIAAAGMGERMGGPKALLAIRWGDNSGELPLAIAHARAHLEGGAARVVLVTRAEVARVLSRFAQPGLDIVVSTARADLGPAGSIRTALELCNLSDDAWLMIEPVDMPASSGAIRRELLSAAARVPAPSAVRPLFEGKRGHPVLVQRKALGDFLSDNPPPLRDVLHRLESVGEVVDVAVEDKRAITDFDVPEDVAAFYGESARFFEEDEPTFA
jgi:molybdenum cofactor cytidylyltransferase